MTYNYSRFSVEGVVFCGQVRSGWRPWPAPSARSFATWTCASDCVAATLWRTGGRPCAAAASFALPPKSPHNRRRALHFLGRRRRWCRRRAPAAPALAALIDTRLWFALTGKHAAASTASLFPTELDARRRLPAESDTVKEGNARNTSINNAEKIK